MLWEQTPVGAHSVRPSSCEVRLSPIGAIVDVAIQNIHRAYPTVTVDHYVIMPNHIHIIIVIKSVADGRTQFAPTVSRIIKQFKGSITKKIGRPIWQKSFFDRVIRNEDEHMAILQYIEENPKAWALDEYY